MRTSEAKFSIAMRNSNARVGTIFAQVKNIGIAILVYVKETIERIIQFNFPKESLIIISTVSAKEQAEDRHEEFQLKEQRTSFFSVTVQPDSRGYNSSEQTRLL